MSGLVWAIVAGAIAIAVGAYFMARSYIKAKQFRAALNAKKRMSDQRRSTRTHTVERLRDGRW